MPNIPVPAAGEAMPAEGHKSRRSALGLLAALPALAAVPAAAGAAPADPAEGKALELWQARHALRQPLLDAYKVEWEAKARMPWWSVRGYETLGGDGFLQGFEVDWPAIQGLKPNERGHNTLMRPGAPHLRRLFNTNIGIFGRENALATYRRQLRALAERRKAQRAEERRSGLAAAEAAITALHERLDPIEEAILALSPATPNAAAAVIILGAISAAGPDRAVEDMAPLRIAAIALRHLRPSLRGIIAAHVDDLLDNNGRIGSRLVYICDYEHARLPLQAAPYPVAEDEQ